MYYIWLLQKKVIAVSMLVSMIVSFYIDAIFNGPTICWRRVGRKVVKTQNVVYILESMLFLFPWGTTSIHFQRSHGLCSSQQSSLYNCRCHIVIVSITLLFFPLLFLAAFLSQKTKL